MRCPSCMNELVPNDVQLQLESLVEHVCDPNGAPSSKPNWICPMALCQCHNQVAWIEGGEIFHIGTGSWERYSAIDFIDNNDAPFGTWSRKYNAEQEYVVKKWKPKGLLLELICKPTANEDGYILKRRYKFKVWRKTSDFSECYTPCDMSFGFGMLWFSIKKYHYNSKFRSHELDEFNKPLDEWKKKNWWRRAAYMYGRLMNKIIYNP